MAFPIERKDRSSCTVAVVAKIIEQILPIVLAFPLHETPRQNLVRIDVDAFDRNGCCQMRQEGFPHHAYALTSTIRPVIEAAAAIAGLMRWVRTPGP